jgi:hypothetical protein
MLILPGRRRMEANKKSTPSKEQSWRTVCRNRRRGVAL